MKKFATLLVLSRGASAFFQQPLGIHSFGNTLGGVDSKVASTATKDADFDCTYAALYPRQYVAYKLKPDSGLSPSTLDGDLTKAVWEEVPWTENFVDIATNTTPKFSTAAKIRWDDEFLYVGARLQESDVWATLTEHSSVIYNDNDFEIFVDANATSHFYKEFEVNALNTTWDLCLNKPYSDNGYENSTRVFPETGFDMQPPLASAVKIDPAGDLNDPTTPNSQWSIEVALPLDGLVANSTTVNPTHGSMWRMTFSRVQWGVAVNETTGEYEKDPACQSCADPGSAVEDNWVWSPMYAVDMHNPERWSVLQFSDGSDDDDKLSSQHKTAPKYYDEWPARAAAAAVYWAQRSFADANNGEYALSYAALTPYSTAPFHLCPSAQVEITATGSGSTSTSHRDNGIGRGSGGGEGGYFASVRSPDGTGIVATVTDDRFFTVSRDVSEPRGPCSMRGGLRVVFGNKPT